MADEKGKKEQELDDLLDMCFEDSEFDDFDQLGMIPHTGEQQVVTLDLSLQGLDLSDTGPDTDSDLPAVKT